MKQIILTSLGLLLAMSLFSQAPQFQRFNYQAAIRESGILLANTEVDLRFTIHADSEDGPIEYQESHTATTNPYGVLNVVVGDGTYIQGGILTLGLDNSILFLEVEIDTGSGYTDIGTNQIGSVPLASTALFSLFDDDQQSLTVTGQELSIENGNTVTIPSVWNTNSSNAYYSTGNVGIGVSNPDADLVVGSNFGDNWAAPAITVGGDGEEGGVVQVGTDLTQLVLEGGTLDATQSRITASTASGFGTGEVLINANSLNVGGNAGEPSQYRLSIKTSGSGYGFLNSNTDESHNWEQYVITGGDLRLYADDAYVGFFNPSSGAYSAVSDRTLKTNIEPLESVLSRVMEMQPSRYQYKANNPDKKESLGFIAQDVKELFPELVHVSQDKRSKGIHTMDYSGLGVIALTAIQEQQAEIEELKSLVDDLLRELQDLKK